VSILGPPYANARSTTRSACSRNHVSSKGHFGIGSYGPDNQTFDEPHVPYNRDKYHPGACFEIRTKSGTATGAGQQCTYDRNGDLITGGLAAGTPDRVNVPYWVWYYPASGWNKLTDEGHIGHDVSPFDMALQLDGAAAGEHVKLYLSVRQPNNGNGCRENIVNSSKDPNGC
jgi:hypothetical protein